MKINKLKISKYAFLIGINCGYILYSTSTGAIIKITEQSLINRTQELFSERSNITYNSSDVFIRTLYENGMLVPDERNEFEFQKFLYEQSIVSDRALQLTILTTRQCNLRCVYCYEEHRDEHMSSDIYNGIIKYIDDSLYSRIYNSVNISLFGGEPFFDFKKVYSFISKTSEICKRHNCHYSCSATTNGVLLTPKRFEKLISAGCTDYQISIDGIKETHDSHRIRVDGSGSWDTIISNLTYMKQTSHWFRVIIRTNFDEDVINYAEEFYRYIKENFDDPRFTIYYENIKKLGGCNDDNIEVVSGIEKMVASISIAEILAKYGLKCECTNSRSLPYGQMCPAARHNSYTIDCDGKLMKCTLSIDDNINNVGYINKDGKININYDNLFKWMRPNCDHPECMECKILPLCMGRSCVNGQVHGEKFYCNHEMHEIELSEMMKENWK